MPTDSRVLDIVSAALQTAAIDDPRKDSGEIRPAIRLSNEESRHFAYAALKAIEDAGFVVLPKEEG